MNYLADIPIGELRGKGPLGLETGPFANSLNVFNQLISSTIGLLSIIAIIWFTFTLITAGISIITGGGDKGSLETAKKKLTNALVGLLITLTAVLLIDLIGFFFDIKFLQVAAWVPILAPK